MRVALLSIAVASLAACSSQHGESICANTVPPPAACMTACDPTPGAPDTCPLGYHCTPDGKCDAQCLVGGNQCGDGYTCTTDGNCVSTTGCQGLACQVVDCKGMNLPSTTITGTVFAPNGTLPLYDVQVYVPNGDPGPLTAGAVCSKCSDSLPGFPIVKAITDEAGNFTLADVPAGANIPLVIVSGKWRRQIVIPNVAQCMPNALPPTSTSLPKSKTDTAPPTKSVDLPKIAISTGSADALECLIRKLGIADSEITTDGQPGNIHLYTDSASGGQGAAMFQSGFPGGTGNFKDSTTLWGSLDKMKSYDIVINSCEGGQYQTTKPQASMDALKAYADFGGRVFLSHWHNVWIEGAAHDGGTQKPAVWPTIATWNNSNTTFDTPPDNIDEANNPKGSSFATWMLNVMGSPSRDLIPIGTGTGKNTCSAVDNAKAERWVYWNSGGQQLPQNFQFTTPNEVSSDQRCGKVVFSDMHVSGDSNSDPAQAYPGGCSSMPLTPQEKAIAFMFFDLSSCVGGIF